MKKWELIDEGDGDYSIVRNGHEYMRFRNDYGKAKRYLYALRIADADIDLNEADELGQELTDIEDVDGDHVRINRKLRDDIWKFLLSIARVTIFTDVEERKEQ